VAITVVFFAVPAAIAFFRFVINNDSELSALPSPETQTLLASPSAVIPIAPDAEVEASHLRRPTHNNDVNDNVNPDSSSSASGQQQLATTTTMLSPESPRVKKTAKQVLDEFTTRKWGIAMTQEEILFFLQVLLESHKYFEWGTGGSTLLAGMSENLDTIVSVDGLQSWQVETNKTLSVAYPDARVIYRHLDYDANPADWSRPKGFAKRHVFPRYSQAINEFPPKTFDLILDDGRFRTACAFQAWLHMSEDAKLFLHDCSRSNYNAMRAAFHLIGQKNQLCLFKKNMNYAPDLAARRAKDFEFDFSRL